MDLNFADQATPATRLRLTYTISSGALSGAAGAQAATDAINQYLGGASGLFIVSPATAPQEGGSPGSGVISNAFFSIFGRKDYFISVDVRTDYQLGSTTWGDFLQPFQDIPLGLLGLDVHATLSNASVISRTDATATSPAAQETAAETGASNSKANQPALSFLKGSSVLLVILAILIGAVYLGIGRGSAAK